MNDVTTALQNAKRIFVSALEQEPGAVTGYLRRACGTNDDLRARVESLLRAHEEASSVLENTPLLPPEVARAEELAPGDVIGNYRLGRELGEGGFGRVFLAEQEWPVKRPVALKVIKLGMDTRQVITRFEAERQTLALMDHPNIAGVLDAGTTTSGRPYFVMEYVPGRPIAKYCREKNLGLEERVQLVRKCCAAIQHAHVKGVLHRDIKPSNVLVVEVDGTPEPRVIDFGIAKAIAGEGQDLTALTMEGLLIGTPAYMSPEQVGAERDIDTRSDVHALGVLLFELLVGRTPFANEDDSNPTMEVIRLRILHVEAEAPSSVAAGVKEAAEIEEVVPRELDWVVLRCLAKDRERRYSSAAALGLDLQRYLTHEPVEAAPPSKTYLFKKLVRRHRAAAGTIASVTVALILGAVGTLAGLFEARAESREARLQAEIANAVNAFLTDDLLSAVRPSTAAGEGWDVPMSEVLDAAAGRIEAASAPGGRFAEAPRVEASIRLAIGGTYQILGRYIEAEPQLVRAEEIFRAELGPEHEETLKARTGMIAVLLGLGRYEECVTRGAELLPVLEEAWGPDNTIIVSVKIGMGHALRRLGRPEDAARIFHEALARARAKNGDEAPEAFGLMNALGMVEDALGHNDEAEKLLRAAYEGRQRVLGPLDADTLASMQNLGGFLWGEGRVAEAQPLLEGAVREMERLDGPDHASTIRAKFNLAGLYRQQGELDRAEGLLLETYESCMTKNGPEHIDTIKTEGALARLAEERGEYAEAEAVLLDVAERCAEAHGELNPATLTLRKDYVACIFSQGRLDEAHGLYVELLEDETEAHGRCHVRTLYTLLNLGNVERRLGDLEAAESYLRELYDCSVELPSGHPMRRDASAALARCLREQGRDEEADALGDP